MNARTVQTAICRVDDLSETERRSLASSPGSLCRVNGRVFLLLDHTVISCTDDSEGNELLYSILLSRRRADHFSDNMAEVYYRLLEDPDYLPDQTRLRTEKTNLPETICAVVFQSYSPIKTDLYTVISDMAPLQSGDTILPIDYRTVVFVRRQKEQLQDELKEYTEAVLGTLEDEGITGVKAGIGRFSNDLSGFRRSYHDGINAIAIGNRFRNTERVYLYDELTLERILNCIPGECTETIRNDYSSLMPFMELSGEILETVRVFFKNDLNLTAASRELFIHRNTLNYRLDKIKKETGLDLRSFHDAVVFKVLTEMTNSD